MYVWISCGDLMRMRKEIVKMDGSIWERLCSLEWKTLNKARKKCEDMCRLCNGGSCIRGIMRKQKKIVATEVADIGKGDELLKKTEGVNEFLRFKLPRHVSSNGDVLHYVNFFSLYGTNVVNIDEEEVEY